MLSWHALQSFPHITGNDAKMPHHAHDANPWRTLGQRNMKRPPSLRAQSSDNYTAGGKARNLDESFVLLAGASAIHRQGSPDPQVPASGVPMQNLDDRFQQMAHVFEIASSETKE